MPFFSEICTLKVILNCWQSCYVDIRMCAIFLGLGSRVKKVRHRPQFDPWFCEKEEYTAHVRAKRKATKLFEEVKDGTAVAKG
jgi:hypothetical protein